MGIDFISYQENIDTTTPTGELIFHVMASPAQFESSLINQSTHTWHHINLHGEFYFSEEQIAPTFDMEAILNLFKP